MTLSRTLLGILVGVIAAFVWQVLGAETLLWVVLLGLAGGAVGYVLDKPGRLIEYLRRLER